MSADNLFFCWEISLEEKCQKGKLKKLTHITTTIITTIKPYFNNQSSLVKALHDKIYCLTINVL